MVFTEPGEYTSATTQFGLLVAYPSTFNFCYFNCTLSLDKLDMKGHFSRILYHFIWQELESLVAVDFCNKVLTE